MADGGAWGFKGEQNRGLELPAGSAVSPSQQGRCRLRYNEVSMALEVSLDGGAFTVIGTGGASPWTEAAGVIRQQNVASQVVMGAALPVGAEQVRIVGNTRIDSTLFVSNMSTSAGDLGISSASGTVTNDVTGGVFGVVDGGDTFFEYNSATNAVREGNDTAIGQELTLAPAGSTWTSNNGITLGDNGGNAYVQADITGNQIILGNLVTNPDIVLNTGGDVVIPATALCLTEQAADPAAVANTVKLYAKDVLGDSQLFARSDSGTVYQLTPVSGTPGGADTEVQYNNAGAFAGDADFTFDGTSVSLTNVLNANGGVDVGAAGALTLGSSVATSVDLGSTTATVTATVSAAANAFLVTHGGAAPYISVDATGGSESVTLGNSSTNPSYLFAGSGEVQVDGDAVVLTEQGADPTTTANAGKVYTKDAAAITELYYKDSAGNVVQITSGGAVNASATPGGADTEVQYNNAGAFAGDADFTFDGTSVSLTNVLNANGGVDVGAAGALTLGSSVATSVDLGSTTATVTATVSAAANAFLVTHGGAAPYISVDATGGSESVTLGNSSTNPSYLFAGSGEVQVDGDAVVLTEQGADPTTTANAGKVYTKDAAAITELYYKDSAGNVVQITSGGAVNASATPGGANTQVQYNNAGAFAGDADFTFDGTNVTLANSLFANGGVDRSTAAALSIGTTNASSVTVGSGNTLNLGGSSVAQRLDFCTTNLAANVNGVYTVKAGGVNVIRINSPTAANSTHSRRSRHLSHRELHQGQRGVSLSCSRNGRLSFLRHRQHDHGFRKHRARKHGQRPRCRDLGQRSLPHVGKRSGRNGQLHRAALSLLRSFDDRRLGAILHQDRQRGDRGVLPVERWNGDPVRIRSGLRQRQHALGVFAYRRPTHRRHGGVLHRRHRWCVGRRLSGWSWWSGQRARLDGWRGRSRAALGPRRRRGGRWRRRGCRRWRRPRRRRGRVRARRRW